MTSNDNEDPTVPGAQFPDENGPEDRTIPSGQVPSSEGGEAPEDPTMPSGRADAPGAEDATMPSGQKSSGPSGQKSSGGAAGGGAAGTGDAGGAEDRTVPALNSASHSPGELMGKTIGGCRIDKLLGRGAMGAVYKARQLKLDRDVAVKVIRPEMMTDPRMLKRFEVEARTVGKFNSANVVMVHDVGFELGVHYLVMEFVKGKNLREHVKLLAGGRLPAGEALPLIRQACKGLDEARRLNVVHRDIKPDNLMLTDQEILKIADFGIAKPEEDFSMTLTSELIGTPLYMSPEQCQGGADLDFRSDMYSLGATFFYLLTGEPPIRASSVYELIQTKTKLENLCLWKSLPELDENHPLSRVIERMTANDREDRYESYEELLNDLVLVEAGETITVRAKKLKKAIVDADARDRAASAPKKGGGMLMAVLLLLVVAGGGSGYWWWSNQQTVEVAPDVEEARKALDGLRSSLAADGPSDALRKQVLAVAVPAALSVPKASLLSDVEAGIQIQQDLAKLQAPKPKLPFDQLAPFFAAVDKAAAVPAKAGSELRSWAAQRRTSVRDEDALGRDAVAALRQELQDWKDAREGVKGDDVAVAGLLTRLKVISACRTKLFDLLSGQRSALNEFVNADELEQLRLGLIGPAGPTGTANFAERLGQIRDEFHSKGALANLKIDAEKLVPNNTAEIEARKELINEMRRVEQCVAAARSSSTIYPTKPMPPEFVDVENFFEVIRSALDSDDVKVDGKLRQWAVDMTEELRREDALRPAVVRACKELWDAWQELRKNGAPAVTLETRMKEIQRAVVRAKELFPDKLLELETVVPLATLQEEMDTVKVSARRQAWRTALAAANAKLTAVNSLMAWDVVVDELTASAQTLRQTLADLGGDPQLDRELKLFDDACKKWSKAKEDFLKAASSLASGSITQCLADLRSASKPPSARGDFDDLQGVADRCREAFEMVEKELKVSAAKAELAAAQSVARNLRLPPAVVDRIGSWQEGVARLDSRSSGMVPILGGVSRNPRAEVAAFWMSATECSVDEFRQFVADVNTKVAGKDAAERFASVAPKFASCGLDEKGFATLVMWRLFGNDQMPASVKWVEAAAYCDWYGLNLPTQEEWSLAAFGDGGGARTYPWGNQLTMKMEDRNITSSAVEVRSGGLCWRSEQGVSLHHIAGNVAEWLQAEPAGLYADCAGGGYSDKGATFNDYASGRKVRSESRSRPRSDVGFRTVLRPRAFPDMSWPK